MGKEHTVLYDNIKALSKHKGIRMQDIEKGIYRQIGYLSRGKHISAVELNQIAKILDVSMDDLMNNELADNIAICNLMILVKMNIRELMKHSDYDGIRRQLLGALDEVFDE